MSGITSSLTIDSGFSTSLMINLALNMRHSNVAGIPNWTYPTVNSTAVPGALDAVPSADQQVVNQFLSYGIPKPKPAANTTLPVGAPSSITVKVVNGSGIAGQAGEAANALKADGFRVSSTGDANNFNYPESVIEYGAKGLGEARALQAKVNGGATLQEVLPSTAGTLVLITGHSYPAATGTKAAALTAFVTASFASMASAPTTAANSETGSSAATSTVISPDSSSYYHDRYIPPGLQPGQVPPTCPS